MSYLLDTHILLWWLFNDLKLDKECRDIIRHPNHNILVSSVSAWEIATKYRIGKLPEAKFLVEHYQDTLNQAKFNELTITVAHALRAGNLPILHRDPFDRMLMAQAELEELPIITYDQAFQTGLIEVIPSASTVIRI
ncbi:type II toxin-antitoxin system VapC family toxin [Planktothrix agardhii]|nr:type II toxin-antitoxin system VapC family toxin [Planktothrix agardhii]MCB8752689.1 type II toxin-antitoxin system VapC family toxin [Planktothrix agardhii 1810]MCB8761720.1 type II toxin-antitoxin system VapC family toxin [Planktothrix agardhii 1813]MCB8776104.1 type II toxin-antitoxin system VapC family toxin [Planktothrix agardhii 1031]MCB8784862.1 type II toxin-antitoxin system VapC family toxin [Planktothrix agardhii 1025]MCF3573471.1 type II toxin-antitoxin system VapC family toxin [